MILDKTGLPRENGATDYMDCARLVGILATINSDQQISALNMGRFTVDGVAFRYPDVDEANAASNNPRNVTRDQILCLAAGFYFRNWFSKTTALLNSAYTRTSFGLYRAQNIESDVVGSRKAWYNGADILSPSHMNHLRLCARQRGTAFGYLWLNIDIAFYSLFTPKEEPNQLLCMAVIAGPKYVKRMRRWNRHLDTAVRDYWSGWRAEPELAERIVSFLHTYV